LLKIAITTGTVSLFVRCGRNQAMVNHLEKRMQNGDRDK
jgi:uncharacterized membrane protein